MPKMVSKKVIIAVLSIAPLLSFSQNTVRIDSLAEVLESVGKRDTSIVDLYLQLGWEYRKSSPDSTILYSQKALELIERLNATNGIANAYNNLGIGYHYKGDNVKSFEFFSEALNQAKEYKDTLQYGHALNSLGRLYMSQGDFIKSYDSYFEALKIFQRMNDQGGIGYCYKSLAELYQTQNNFEKALEMSEKAFHIRVETNNLRGQISILIEIAGIYQQKQNFDKAFDHYLQAKVKAESIDDRISIASIDLGISKLYFEKDKYDESLIFGLKAQDEAGRTSNLDLLGKIQLQLGKVYFEQNKLPKSELFLNQVIKNTELGKEISLQRDAYYYLSEIAKKEQNIAESYDYFLRYSELDQALNSAEVARNIERLEAKFEIEKKDREYELLLVQQARDEAVISRQKIQNIALLATVVVVSTLLIFIWVMNNKRKAANLKLREKNEEIDAQREEIGRQNDYINNQNDKLQKRNTDLAQINQEKDTLMNIVAHDLKSPFNRIQGISELMKLSGLSDEQKNYNALLQDVSQSGINLIRDLLDVNSFEDGNQRKDISEVDAGDMLLEKAKYFYADAKAKNIEVITHVQDSHAHLMTDRVYLSRILDNLISNSIKFSNRDSQVVIGATKENDKIKIVVEDSGLGFSIEDKKHIYKKFTRLSAKPTAGESSNGLGLAIVKTLVDRLEGEIILDSSPGKGSKFTLLFPISLESGLKKEAPTLL